jgi:hypothetical protein
MHAAILSGFLALSRWLELQPVNTFHKEPVRISFTLVAGLEEDEHFMPSYCRTIQLT